MACSHRTTAGHLRRQVSGGVHSAQGYRPAGAVAASAQRRRVGVEHPGTAQYPVAARVAQHQPVAQHQRQLPAEREPGVVCVERP